MKKKINIIPVFVPHFGCPNDCVFCNQKKITNYRDRIDKTEIRGHIERELSYFSHSDSPVEIAFFGGSFTGIDRETMIEYLEIANEYIKSGKVGSIRLSTRPDYIDEEILEILKKYNVKTIELGVQSMVDQVLKDNNRCHDSKVVYAASSMIKHHGFILGLQMMVGLYGDNEKNIDYTAGEFVKIAPDFVRIYPTLIIKNTELERLYINGKYEPLSLEKAVDIIVPIYCRFKLANIEIIRIGLQPTDNIAMGKDVVAGPFHPAFRQLVEEKIFGRAIVKAIGNRKFNNIIIKAPNSILSAVVGNGGVNKKWITQKFNPKKISYMGEKKGERLYIQLDHESIDMDICNIYRDYL